MSSLLAEVVMDYNEMAREIYREAIRRSSSGPLPELQTAIDGLYRLAKEPRECPSCGRIMSRREADEQAICNDCQQ